MKFIYLHGLASSPFSRKAHFLRRVFSDINLRLEIPDLNQGSFRRLTVSRQCDQVQCLIEQSQEAAILLGSSLGGLTAALVANRCPQVAAIVLLAPALDFLKSWQVGLGDETLRDWQTSGAYSIFHYGAQRKMDLGYQFIEDLKSQPPLVMRRRIPMIIFHGLKDEVVPHRFVQKFVGSYSWIELMLLNSDHALTDQLPVIWHHLQRHEIVRPYLQ